MNRRDASSRTSLSNLTSLPQESRLRPAGLAVAIGTVLGLALPGAVAAGDAGSQISTDQRTDTSVTALGPDRWKVTTNTVKERNGTQVAFNSFREFGIAQGQTVDLVLPSAGSNAQQVNNLVNLVTDSKAYINGTLNSVLESSGAVGGKVFFVDPHGLLVGSTGVLNVGSLSVATPTRAAMDDILDAGSALDGLMYGTLTLEQISRTGEVGLHGTINASHGVRVQARAIDVTGTILVQTSSPRDSDSDLQRIDDTAVNTGPNTPLALVNDGGRIQLRAAAISDTGLGLRSADASVVVRDNAMLAAQDIELSAVAIVDSGYDKDAASLDELKADLVGSLTDTSTLQGLGDALVNLGVDKVLGEQVSFLHASTTARVEVKDSASLSASGDIALHASTRQVIDNSAAGKAYEKGDVVVDAEGNPVKDAAGNPVPKKHLLSLGAAYAQINATTEAIIGAGASVNADGGVSVKADAETALKLAAESYAVNNTTAAFTAAISNVNVNTRAVIERGNAVLNAGSVNVSAVNTSSLDTSATARADKNGAVGLAGAVSLQDIAAEARLDRNVIATGDVIVQAASVASLNKTSALITGPKSEPLPGEEEVEAISSGSDGLMGMAQSLVGSGIGAAVSKLSGEADDGSPTPPTTPTAAARFRLGGAISFIDGNHRANASIGAGTRINSGSNIVVDSQVIDAQIGNHAISNVLAKGKNADGSAFALSGAVSIANLQHEAHTLIGSGSELSAVRVGLASDVRLPRDFSALTGAVPQFSSFDAFKDSISAAKDLITDPSDLFASYAAARGSAEEVAIGGAVSYFKATNSARTDVASGVTLTSSDTTGAAWNAVLDGADQAGVARERGFAASTTIKANVDVTALHAAGDLALKNLTSSNVGDGGAALGGSVGYMDYENIAAAMVNDGATLDAGVGSLQVDAANKESIVALALQSGQGGSIGVSGTATALDLDSRTLAGVSNRANLIGSRIGVSADEDLFVWSVAGAVAMSDSVSVGASVAYQQMDTDTRAFVGQVPADFVTGSSAAPIGSVSTGHLSVTASSEGLAGAVAAAGAVVKSSSEALQKQQEALAQKQNAENPGFLDSMKTRALGKVTALEGMAKDADASGSAGLTQYFDKAKGLLGAGDNPPGQGAQTPQPKFGIAVSGSATVNRVRQNTRADISQAVIKDNSGNGVKLDVAAENKTLLVSVSGALSVAAAGSDNSQGSASLAGGVAYGDVRNQTTAALLDSRVEEAGDVSVTARNESEQVNVGLSVGVNASSDQSTAVAAAISATVAMSHNDTSARIASSTITGKAGQSDVDVRAVNASKIANGGGALYFGGKAGLGAAATYAEVGDATRASISGGTLSDVHDVRVRAADSSRIIAAAASGGASTRNDGVAIAGSVLVNQIANQTVASIDGGASIDFSGDLEAFAGTATISDVSGSDDGCGSGFSMDYCGTAIGSIDVDANADDASSEDTQVDTAGRNNARSSIIAVAGMVQVGGNNAGVAFAYNTINNLHAVSVNDAALTATEGGSIRLSAVDQADILAVSAGIGGSTGNFTGVGSASYNAIGNTTSVLVGRSVPDAQGAVRSDGATLTAGEVHLDARDEAFIGSLAGAVTLGSKVAVGAALTVNDIGNTTLAHVEAADLDVRGGTLTVEAANAAKILSGAVAAGAANNVAIQGSAGWSTISNNATASLSGGTVQADRIALSADNDSKVYTLTGAVAGSGTAAIGAAVNIASISDTTRADVDGSALAVTEALDVSAVSTATTKTLAIAGALAGTASIAGSNATNLLDNTTEASLRGVIAQGAGVTGTVDVSASTSGAVYSLGGALAVGGTAGVGVGSSVSTIKGRTTAAVEQSDLHGASGLAIDAANSSLVRTAAVSGAAAGTAAVAASVTTNFVTSTTEARLVDSVVANEAADVTVGARDERRIDSLAGSAAVAGSVGVGAAVAYNDIGGSTSAVVKGAALDLDVRNLLVSADASGAAGGHGNRIRTLAAGLGGGAAVGGAASVAVNNMTGTVSARIEGGADVVAQDNVGVLAAQAQQIDVFAGSVGAGGNAGIGLGTIVNLVDGTTEATISGTDTAVTALGQGAALSGINNGRRTSSNAHSSRTESGNLDFDSVDLGTGTVSVSGLAVNAATRQQIHTLGVSGALGTIPISSGAVAVMAAVNRVAGSTSASISDAKINQHGRVAGNGADAESTNLAALAQAVDVRASHHVASANYVTGMAASPGVFSGAGALSTNLFDSHATAFIKGATVNASDAVVVEANASQNALAIVVGAAAGLSGGAATGVVNDFNTTTHAGVVGGTLRAGSLQITADSDNAASLVGGAGAVAGGAAVAGTALVNIGQATTVAQLGDATQSTTVDVGDALSVSALSRSDFKGVAVSGAGAGGVGVAGMAQLHLLQNTTQALVQNSAVAAGDIAVTADDVLRLSSYSGALGVGLMGTGIGAGASVAILGSSTRANVLDSTLQASGSVDVSASSDRAVDMITVTGGVGASVGIGGAASLLLAGIGNSGDSQSELGGTFGSLKQLGSGDKIEGAALEGTLGNAAAASLNARGRLDIGELEGRGDLVQASIVGGTVQAGTVEVDAEALMRSTNTAGGVGVGGVGVGGAFAMTGLYGTTEALLDAGSTQARSVQVTARAGDGVGGKAAGIDVLAGAAGLVGVGAAVGMANLQQTVKAGISGNLQGVGQAGTLQVRASDDSALDVAASGMAAGAAAVGAVVATATRDARVDAALHADSVVSGFQNVSIDAQSQGGAQASALGAAGGVLAGASAAVALADDASDVRAWIGERSRISGVNGNVNVSAKARPDVSAEALGAAVAAGLAVGAAVADATSHTRVHAYVGADSVLANRGGLNVLASLDGGTVDARAVAGSGGLYLAGAGAFADAASENTVTAEIGDGAAVHGAAFTVGGVTDYARGGAVSLGALSNSTQHATATGVSLAGLLAAGVARSTAGSDSNTRAEIGEGALVYAGNVNLSAAGTDENRAGATAGSGGLVAGNAALASTSTLGNTQLSIGRDAVLDVSRLDARALHDSRYAGRADSTSAGVVNASGAIVSNVVDSDVGLEVGAAAQIVAGGSLVLRTDNNINSVLGGELAASAAGGGVLTGSASSVTTDLDGSSTITIGRDSLLRAGSAPAGDDPGALDLVAGTRANTDDRAGLTTGGAINVALVKARTDAALSNRVDIADNAALQSNYMLNVGTYAATDIGATALVNTWGVLAAVGISDAVVNLDMDQQVNVGSGAALESLHNAFVSAGQDGMNGWTSRVAGNAVSLGYSRGLIAVPDSSAAATVNSAARTTLAAGSELLSGAFVSLGAYGENVFRNADGAATGYQLGFIPVTVRDSRASGTTIGDVRVDGRVVAGRYNLLDIVIDEAGVLTSSGGGGDVLPFSTARENSAALRARLNADGIHDFDQVAGKATNTRTIGDLYAAGGDVVLFGRSIQGTGSITAKGAPGITITNRSTDNLLLSGDILVPEYSGGNVLFTGTSNQADGINVSQNPGQGNAHVTIRNEALTGSGAIASGGLISVTGGDLSIYNALGNIQSWGEQLAENISINAPNGEVGFNLGSANWYGNAVSSLWSAHSLAAGITSADDAAAYIATAQYGAAAAAAGKSLTDYLLYQNSDGSNNNGTGSILIYGACRYRIADKDCTQSSLANQFHDGGQVSKYSYKDTNYLPNVNARTLSRVLNSQPDDVTNAAIRTVPSTGSGVNAGSGIKITANYIDVNVALKAGRPVDYSAIVVDSPALRGWIDELNSRASKGIYDVDPRYVVGNSAGSTKIALKYDSLNRQFIVPDISANGGGSIYLDGRIVSSSQSGSLNVVSGKGSVVIDNGLQDVGLQLGNILVGNGAPGQITVRDRELGVTSWYLRDGTGNVTGYAGDINALSWDSAGVTRLADTQGYDPRAGMRASWDQTARIQRNISRENGFTTAENWRWVDGSGNTVFDGQQWTNGAIRYAVDTSNTNLFESKVTGRFTSSSTNLGVNYRCEKDNKEGCRYNYGHPGRNQFLDGDTWRTHWSIAAPTNGTLTVSNSVKADNRIGIKFSANDAGLLDIDSGQTIRINGVLKNTDGKTFLTSDNGSIDSVSRDARIITNQLTLEAGKSIGTIAGAQAGEAANPIDVQMVSYVNDAGATIAPGTLTARAGGDIALDVDSAAKVNISAGSTGDVWLRAKYDLEGANSSGASITGSDITLLSTYGAIGSVGRPLVIDARERIRADGTLDGGLVTARAAGDIGLRDLSGDFWVQHIESTTGDVFVDAAAGSIFSASQRAASSFLSADQLASLRDNLKLFQGGGEQSVISYQSQVDASYAEFFQLSGLGHVAGGSYVPGNNAITLYRSLAEAARGTALDDAGVATYLAERYARLVDVFADAYGAAWQQEAAFAAFNAGYRYDLADRSGDSALAAARKQQVYASLTDDSQWNAQQISYVFNANALEPTTGSALNADPVIVGRNVTLRARDDLGRLDKEYTISLADVNSGNISADALLAMRLATTPGDVEMLDALGNVLSAQQVRDGAVVASLRVRSTAPVVLDARGDVDVVVGGDAFVHGDSSLNIRNFQTGGDARIGSDGDIVSVAGANQPALTIGRNLSLSALRSIMGSNGQPLRVQVNGSLLLANAGEDVMLSQQSGDLRIGVVNANEDVVLEAAGGSLLSYLKGVSTITGRDIQLVVRDDIRDADGSALALRIIAGGQLNGEADGAVRLSSDRDMVIGTLRAGGDLQLLSSAGAVSADTLHAGSGLDVTGFNGVRIGTAEAGLDAVLSAPLGDVAVDQLTARSAQINAGRKVELGNATVDQVLKVLAIQSTELRDGAVVSAGESVDIEARGLQMGAGSVLSAGKQIAVRSSADIMLGKVVVSGNEKGSTVTLTADGGIQANGDAAVNIGGGSEVATVLLAGEGIGRDAQPLTVDTGRLQMVRTARGDVVLQLPNGAVIGSAEASTGDVLLASGGALSADALLAGGSVAIDALTADITRVQAGRDVQLTTTRQMALGVMEAGGNAALDSGTALLLGQATVGGNATLDAGTDADLGQLDVGQTLTVTAGGVLAVDTAKVGGNATLTSTGSTTIDTMDVQGALLAASGAALTANALKTGSTMQLTSTDELDVQQLLSGSDLTASAGSTLSLAEVAVTGNASLDAGTDADLGQLDVGQALTVTAGGVLAVDKAQVGGNATLTSTGSTTIDTMDVQGALLATSGAALTAKALSTGSTMQLTSTNALDVQQLLSGSDLTASAGSTLTVADATVTGNASVDAGTDADLGQLDVGQALKVTAGGVLAVDTAKVGGNASLTSTGSTTIDTMEVQGALLAASGAALTAKALKTGSTMQLTSTDALDVQQLLSGSDLIASAGSTLTVADATVTGNASLDAGTDAYLGQLDVGQALTVTAGGLLAVDTAKVGGNATLSSTGSTTIDTMDLQGTLLANSGAALTAKALSTGSMMQLSSTDALDVQQLRSGADLTASAGSTLSLADATVTGNSSLDAGTDADLGQLDVGQALTVTAGGVLAVDTAQVGGNATLTSTGSTTIDTMDVQGALLATSGAALTANALSTGSTMQLTSTDALDVQQLRSGADLTASAGSTLSLADATVTGNASLDAGTDADLGQLDVGQALTVTAGGVLAVDTAQVGGNATLTSTGSTIIDTMDVQGALLASSGAALTAKALSTGSTMQLSSTDALDVQQLRSGSDLIASAGSTLTVADADVSGNALLSSTGDTQLTRFNSDGNLDAEAGGTIAIDRAAVAGSMRLRAAHSINVGTAMIGVDGDWAAGDDLVADEVTSGCAFSGEAGATLSIAALQTGCGLQLTSGETLHFDNLSAGTDIALVSRRGDVRGRELTAGRSLRIDAAGDIVTTTGRAAQDLTARSGRTQQWGSFDAGRDVQLAAGSDIDFGRGQSGAAQQIISGASIRFGQTTAGTTVSLDAQGGSLDGQQLHAVSAGASARDQLALAQAVVDTRLNLAATDIQAHVQQTGQGEGPLTTTLTGYRNGMARKVVVEVEPRDAWLIDHLQAMDLQLASTAQKVEIRDGNVQNTMSLVTPTMNLLMDNNSPILRPVDVQLMQLDRRFHMAADGRLLDTNAYVVRFSDGFRTANPNYNRDHLDTVLDYRGESAVRYMGRMLELPVRGDTQRAGGELEKNAANEADVISAGIEGAVNLGAPN